MKPALLLALTLAAFTPARASDITGRVLDSQTGEGILRARVTLTFYPRQPSSPDNRGPLLVLTDDTGAFAFRNLPDGSYQLSAEKNGYLNVQDHSRLPGIPMSTITEKEPPPVQTLTLTKQAVIQGRLTGENGQPLLGHVTLVREPLHKPGQPDQPWSTDAQVDRSGEFRFAKLEAARYYLAGQAWRPFNESTACPPVYYPGKPTRDLASPIDVQPGQVIQLEFRREPVPAYQIRGTGNCPIAPALERAGDPNLTMTWFGRSWDATTRTFHFDGLASGTYNLTLADMLNGQTLRHSTPVTVDGADVTGIQLICDFSSPASH